MSRVVVLGAGVMGTAITVPLSDRGHQVSLVGTHLDEDIISRMKAGRGHPRLGIAAPAGVVPRPLAELDEAADGADLLILGVSSAGIPWAAEQLARVLPARGTRVLPILAVTKGLAVREGRLTILPHLLRELLPVPLRDRVLLSAVGGPCIAAELAARRQTSVVFAGTDAARLEHLVRELATDSYHPRSSTDLVGVELCAALKNFFAIAVGSCRGELERLGGPQGPANHNPAAALFAQSMAELTWLVEHLGGSRESALLLPGAGDLYVTSQSGRNARLGEWLGRGLRFSEVRQTRMAGETIEGAELALAAGAALESLADHMPGDSLPLTRALVDAICRDRPLEIPWRRFAT